MQKFRTNNISMQDILFFHRKISGKSKKKIKKDGRFWVGFESIVGPKERKLSSLY